MSDPPRRDRTGRRIPSDKKRPVNDDRTTLARDDPGESSTASNPKAELVRADQNFRDLMLTAIARGEERPRFPAARMADDVPENTRRRIAKRR